MAVSAAGPAAWVQAGRAMPADRPRKLWRDAARRLCRNRAAVAGLAVLAVLALTALGAPALSPHDPNQQHLADSALDPAWGQDGRPEYPLGTDDLGRDELSRLLYGARISLAVGLIPLLVSLTVGGGLGLLAGYHGGALDAAIMRLADAFFAFPRLLFVLVLVAAFRQTALGQAMSGLLLVFLALAVVG